MAQIVMHSYTFRSAISYVVFDNVFSIPRTTVRVTNVMFLVVHLPD